MNIKLFLTLALERLAGTHIHPCGEEAESPTQREAKSLIWREAESPT